MKVYGGSRSIAPLILNLGTRWECLTSRCGHFDPSKAVQYLLTRKLGGPQSQCVCFGEEKYSIPHRNLNLGHPACSRDK